MKHFKFTLLAISCLLALTACSSSSGGGGGSAPTYFTEKPQTESTSSSGSNTSVNQNTETSPQNEPKTLKDPIFQGKNGDKLVGALVTITPNGQISGQNLTSYLGEDLNVLMLNKVEIPLLPTSADDDQSGFKAITSTEATAKLGNIQGYTNKATTDYRDTRYYQFVRFGVVSLNNQNTLFVQGLQTPISGSISDIENGYATLYSMPKSGKFVYKKGDALYGKDGNYEQLTADVSADFTNKQLSVSLKDSATKAEKVAFSSVIDGNTFSGSHNGVDSKGAFYGSQANQVAGVFYRTEGTEAGYHGVFGATDKRRDAQ
ncbi:MULTISPECIES: transferrin-binding protein-like solute binding protein [Glaesserella]|uniref:Transferrin-binding protein B C-lobe/N-lobe beta-barrel domain-containing protein n=1 Tax=Glaesserella australis TaxID=2094024 RepID=A0A328C2B8_9PAST|nr:MULTISPECIES: transferrin-binding protein-like solute binding protein [Glaesserella]AUI66856.1 hypothetical protein CJD39_09830 [Glaesserella sp. 15-184]RAL19907.1 hypothetical protein C5N92_00600 [Glaesserella australis]